MPLLGFKRVRRRLGSICLASCSPISPNRSTTNRCHEPISLETIRRQTTLAAREFNTALAAIASALDVSLHPPLRQIAARLGTMMAVPTAESLLALWKTEPRNVTMQWGSLHEAAALFITLTLIFSTKAVSRAALLAQYPGISAPIFQRAVDYLSHPDSVPTSKFIREAVLQYAGTLPKMVRVRKASVPKSEAGSGQGAKRDKPADDANGSEDDENDDLQNALPNHINMHAVDDLRLRKIHTMVILLFLLFDAYWKTKNLIVGPSGGSRGSF